MTSLINLHSLCSEQCASSLDITGLQNECPQAKSVWITFLTFRSDFTCSVCCLNDKHSSSYNLIRTHKQLSVSNHLQLMKS